MLLSLFEKLNCVQIVLYRSNSSKANNICKKYNIFAIEQHFLPNFSIISESINKSQEDSFKNTQFYIFSTIFVWLTLNFITYPRLIFSWLFNLSYSCYLNFFFPKHYTGICVNLKGNWKYRILFPINSTSLSATQV